MLDVFISAVPICNCETSWLVPGILQYSLTSCESQPLQCPAGSELPETTVGVVSFYHNLCEVNDLCHFRLFSEAERLLQAYAEGLGTQRGV
jgi:hypothetical protein